MAKQNVIGIPIAVALLTVCSAVPTLAQTSRSADAASYYCTSHPKAYSCIHKAHATTVAGVVSAVNNSPAQGQSAVQSLPATGGGTPAAPQGGTALFGVVLAVLGLGLRRVRRNF